MSAVRSLAKPGEKVFISVDNTVAWSYIKKGGEDPINQPNDKALPKMVHDQSSATSSCVGKIRRSVGRQIESVGI